MLRDHLATFISGRYVAAHRVNNLGDDPGHFRRRIRQAIDKLHVEKAPAQGQAFDVLSRRRTKSLGHWAGFAPVGMERLLKESLGLPFL